MGHSFVFWGCKLPWGNISQVGSNAAVDGGSSRGWGMFFRLDPWKITSVTDRNQGKNNHEQLKTTWLVRFFLGD